MNRREWFNERIGQTVYSNHPIANNEFFIGLYNTGYSLDPYTIDELLVFETESNGELRFFDTKRDAESYNKTKPIEEAAKDSGIRKQAIDIRFNSSRKWYIRFKSVGAKIRFRR